MSASAATLAAPRRWSLLARLAWIAMTAVAISLVFGGFAMYFAASIQDKQMLDARLEQFGATLETLVEGDALRPAPAAAGPAAKTRPAAALLYRYQVWDRESRRLLIRSHEAPADAPMVELDRLGYATARMVGEEYRVFALPTRDGRKVIQVAENINEAWSQVGLTTAYYAAFLLVPFGLLFIATWWLLRRALHSISAMADSLADRNPLDLTPLPALEPPREIVPIVSAIEQLFGRMQRTLSIERSFTAMAAHEMRTPLAGLRAHAQLLSHEPLPPESMETVQTLMQGVDRASHLLNQLLDLARVEALMTTGQLPFQSVALADIAEEALADLRSLVRSRCTDVRVELGTMRMQCHPFGLSVLMRNLLTNAVRYTPPGGRVTMTAAIVGDATILTVDDSGEGIPEAQRDRAFERFNRLGRSRSDGVGLGLSIVLLVVEMHDAKIQLGQSSLGGLRVQVGFPRPGS